MKPVKCKNCKYFMRDKIYVSEGTCNNDGRYTREERVCNLLDTDEKKREAKVPNKKNLKSKFRWFDPEKEKPLTGQKIIFIDAIGLYMGTFQALRCGVVYVEDKLTDIIEWGNIHQWIPYPDEF